MKTNHYITLMLLMLFGAFTSQAQTNTLSIPDVTVAAGNTISLPINLDNTQDIVGVQFTLTVPDGIVIDPTSAVLTARGEGHQVVMQPVAPGKYMTMVFSDTNKNLLGRTGTLINVSLSTHTSVEEGAEFPLTLSDVILGSESGEPLPSEYSAGKVKIAKSPDLVVSRVNATPSTINPGENISVNWQVDNIGGMPTQGGWSEQIILDGAQGQSKVLSTVYYENPLNDGGIVSRSAEINLPEILGIDGEATVRVKLTPNSEAGEPSWLRGNNEASTESKLTVNKFLAVTPSEVRVNEANRQTLRFYISRSGNTLKDETFTLVATEDSRLSLPEEVTIPKGQSAIYFYGELTPNGALDDKDLVELTLSGNGYEPVKATIKIEDDTLPKLTLTSSVDEIVEGESVAFTIEAERAPKEDLEIKLSCDLSNRFEIPSIILPSGKTSIEVEVKSVDDETPNVTHFVTFTASAVGYESNSDVVDLLDNDIPTLELTLTPDAVSEAAGPLSVLATLTRTDNIDKNVTIKFSDDSDGGIYYGVKNVEMRSGVQKVTLNLGPIDNVIVDGERTYNIEAAVWIAACSCNATEGKSGGVVKAALTVYDNDGPTLQMRSNSSVLKEGEQTEITVIRNTETSSPLVVNLTCDHNSDLEFPASITIPVAETSATFIVKALKNDINDDSFTAVITAESEGFAKGNIWLMVTDQTLPDAQVSAIEVSETEVEVGDEIRVTATLANTGSYTLPEQTKVGFYITSENKPLAVAYLQDALAPGEIAQLSKVITMPDAVGTYQVYAMANESREVMELLYNNNTSATVDVKAVSPFSFTLSTEKSVYQSEETVIITGRVNGKDVAGRDVEVYIINEGARQILPVKADKDGNFRAEFVPFQKQVGHFVTGACYPNEGLTDEMCSFDIYGLKHIDFYYSYCEMDFGSVFNKTFTIKNPSNLPLSGLKVSVANPSENCAIDITAPETIAANSEAEISFSITPKTVSEGTEYERITLNVETNEGATLSHMLLYYCHNLAPVLECSVSGINTTMTKGTGRDYPITITNKGKGETGKITFSMPSWMKLATANELSSLSYDESSEVVIRMTPTAEMDLNVDRTGSIVINCENGNGLIIPFRITPVSEATGNLIVDVCDNYTYYTKEAPHVEGAQVVLKNYSTGNVVATGKTDKNGIFEIEVPEGYYILSVTADKHQSSTQNILVDPGVDNRHLVDIAIKAIEIDFKMERTLIEEEYIIDLETHYEVNVPAPVIKIEGPSSIDGDNMAIGESVIINLSLTNLGLITALNTTMLLPEDMTEWKFEALAYNDPFDLAPQQSVIVPVRITRIADENSMTRGQMRSAAQDMIDTYRNCLAGLAARYELMCGKSLQENLAALRLAMKACASAATLDAILQALGSLGIDMGPGGHVNVVTQSSYIEDSGSSPTQTFTICDPCDAERAEQILNFLVGQTPAGPVWNALDDAVNSISQNKGSLSRALQILVANSRSDWGNKIRNGGKAATDAIINAQTSGALDAAFEVYSLASALKKLIETCKDKQNKPDQSQNTNAPSKATQVYHVAWHEKFDNVASKLLAQFDAANKVLEMAFGATHWFYEADEGKCAFMKYAFDLEEGYIPAREELIPYKPESLSIDQMYAFIRHINGEGENYPTEEDLNGELDIYTSMDDIARENGFENMVAYFEDTLEGYTKYFQDKSSGKSVCATISLRFSQNLVMTREAFHGTLTVYNGHESLPMKDVRLKLNVMDEYGTVATAREMDQKMEKLTGFEGEADLDKEWTLDAGETGVAVILFRPSKFAAPTEPRDYTFGGTLTYLDPFTNLEVTRTLYPVTLSVNPTADLNLTYFLQRDVIGDDPLTEEIEPCEDAEFSLLINNIGYGDATNVRITTHQPEIIENEKGLAIEFEIVSSQLNGGEKEVGIGSASDFGTIPAHSTAYAQWWFRSTLLGHFIDYNVSYTHVNSNGNPDISLLNEVTVKELIRSLEMEENTSTGPQKLVGFMTNDFEDDEDAPDMLYLSNGQTQTVAIAAGATIKEVSETEYILTVTPTEEGWNYGSISDPTYGVVKLMNIVRNSDGAQISLRNFWQTDRVLRDGKDPLYQNRIHFADRFNGIEPQTYTLTFEPKPELVLEVESIENIPGEGELATEHVNSVKVVFNKEILPETFTSEDISFSVQGLKQNVESVVITTEDNKTFTLDLTQLNKGCGNGYYVLTIQTSEITDVDGFNGKTGKTASWNMFQEGLVSIKTAVSPEGAGEVTVSGETVYGQTISLSATANDGYEFVNWTLNGAEVSKEAQFNQTVLCDMTLQANFIKKSYSVTIENVSEGGTICGAYTGIYSYGEELSLSVETNDGYRFQGWIVNEALVSEETSLVIRVDSEMSICAKYEKDQKYEQIVNLSKGWNWVSGYLSSALPLEPIMENAYRIVAQFDETIKDPELGFIGSIDTMEPGRGYKIEALSDCSITYTGDLYNLEQSPIVLNRGWNWIAYPYNLDSHIGSVITNAEEGDCIASQLGFTEYSDGVWEGSIAQFHAGEGYLYKSVAEKNLSLDFENLSNTSKVVASSTNIYDFTLSSQIDAHKYPNTMNIVGRLYLNGEDITDQEYDIYAMSGNELRGLGVMVNGNYYITVYGETPTEISFIIEDGVQTYLANETMMFTSDIVGSRKAPYTFSVGEPTGFSSIYAGDCDIVIYNIQGMLINRKATLDDIRKLEQGVYIINGKKYLVK